MNSRARIEAAHRALRARRYAEAWADYEARRTVAGSDIVLPQADYPEWEGQDIAGKRVMACVEQGHGDQLMFGRYLPALIARGAEVEVLCNPYFLARTFETLGIAARPWLTDRPAPAADYWVMFGSLPYRLGLHAPAPAAYLPIPWRAEGGLGVMAMGSPKNWNDAHRSLPPALASDLLALGRNLAPEATGAMDFLDTAEIVAGLDQVITVDTSVAHLAGAMGKPCTVLLPFDGFDWRWNDAVRSDWYPDFRLIRQPRPGDWASVFAELRAALGL
jgi:hypothetical protein